MEMRRSKWLEAALKPAREHSAMNLAGLLVRPREEHGQCAGGAAKAATAGRRGLPHVLRLFGYYE
jgi:hypothetical protein